MKHGNTKKQILSLLSAVLLFGFCTTLAVTVPSLSRGITVYADTVKDDTLSVEDDTLSAEDFEWNDLSAETTMLTRYTGKAHKLTLPSFIYEGEDVQKKVVAVGSEAFANNQWLEEISIPEEIRSIESEAFQGCYNLKTINITDSLEKIGKDAFLGTQWLTDQQSRNIDDIYLGNWYYQYIGNKNTYFTTDIKGGTKHIANGAFSGCNYLMAVTLPDSLMSIGAEAFYECSRLTEVTIPRNVSCIDQSAFYGCSSLISLTIPSSISVIGYSAFENCKNIEHLTIENGVVRICGRAFYGCQSLTQLRIPGSAAFVENNSFSGCTNLRELVAEEGVMGIGDSAFSDCTQLIDIRLPDSLLYLYSNTFDDTAWYNKATALSPGHLYLGNIYYKYMKSTEEDYFIPLDENTRLIAINAFPMGGSGIPTEITNSDHTVNVGLFACKSFEDHSDGDIYSGKNYYKFKGTMAENTKLEIQPGTLSISPSAFYNQTNLTSVKLPNSLRSIESNAFGNCSGLKSIEIPEGVTYIADYAFANCNNLEKVVIPSTVRIIGYYAFYKCNSLREIVIPDSVKLIGDSAFSNCENLKSVTISSSLRYLGAAFYNDENLKKVTFNGSSGEYDRIRMDYGIKTRLAPILTINDPYPIITLIVIGCILVVLMGTAVFLLILIRKRKKAIASGTLPAPKLKILQVFKTRNANQSKKSGNSSSPTAELNPALHSSPQQAAGSQGYVVRPATNQTVPQGYVVQPATNQTVPQGYVVQPAANRNIPQGYVIQTAPQQSVPQGYVIQTAPQQSVPQGYVIQTTPQQSVTQGYVIQTAPQQSVPQGYVIATGKQQAVQYGQVTNPAIQQSAGQLPAPKSEHPAAQNSHSGKS